jgi:putative heme-binding domain-containing protein
MNLIASSILLSAVMLVAEDTTPSKGSTEFLDAQLRREDPVLLAREARRVGDARRGAVVFYQPVLMCTKCHTSENAGAKPSLGPTLASRGVLIADVDLVEAILEPSKTIKQGYETVKIVTNDGRVTSGLLAEERPDAVVLHDPLRGGSPVAIPKSQIEERAIRGPSIMPAGLVNALGSRQQFLDLVRYLMEIAEHGPARERDLRPDPSLLNPPLPAYEQDLDHAGLITALGADAFRRGEAIYNRVCANCHGTKDKAGSLPTAPRFVSAPFKNGGDPYHMYRTLTDGWGQMPAQMWMVPRQKYDVIHYIREAYLKYSNSINYRRVDRAYLDQLPKGASRGPAPLPIEPWTAMDFGPSISATLEVGEDGSNFALKGIAVRLDAGHGGVSRGRAWVVYDHDTLRLAAAWSGQGFIDWNGINFNGRHQVHPRIVGTTHVTTPDGPGWVNPANGSFADLRQRGRDGRFYGSLPKPWVHFKGIYHPGGRVILAYRVGIVEILESAGVESDSAHPETPIFTRTLEIGPATHDLTMRVAKEGAAVCLSHNLQASLFRREGFTMLRVPASGSSRLIKVLMSSGSSAQLQPYAKSSSPPVPLAPLTRGGPKRWPETLRTEAIVGRDDGPLAVDVLTVPDRNPWLCQMRLTGFDFLPGGDGAAVCTWDGDVWLVTGLDQPSRGLTWQRIASGLFQPLGLKIVDGQIYVGCRDQIVRLHDLNGDGETDFYENFNSDHQVTEHFHEFAMGMQTDARGNFYYAKAARHGLPALVPQHGTLLRVSKDGAQTDILATGFRAPNGVCVGADGTFFLSDQEGFWTPKNRINWVKRGGFYGNMWGYHDVTDPSDSAMELPVCWITNAMDRSPAELLWVDSHQKAWRPLRGALLSLSYGNGKVFIVPHEVVEGQMQGGVCALPLPPFPTGVMRGRFNPVDGQLYTCGMFAWAGDRTQPGGFFRVRATGKGMFVPIALSARKRRLAVTFSGPLDQEVSSDPSRYTAKTWSVKRTAEYGSEHHDEQTVKIANVRLTDNRRTVNLEIPELKPTWCMEVTYAVNAESGESVKGVIHNTIYRLPD